MTAAPAVMTRADLASPSATASALSPVQHVEDADRQLDRYGCLLRDAHQVAERAAADSQSQHTERGASREHVHDDGLQSDRD